MSTSTNLEKLKIHVMTTSQYESATKNSDELYLITDADAGGLPEFTIDDIGKALKVVSSYIVDPQDRDLDIESGPVSYQTSSQSLSASEGMKVSFEGYLFKGPDELWDFYNEEAIVEKDSSTDHLIASISKEVSNVNYNIVVDFTDETVGVLGSGSLIRQGVLQSFGVKGNSISWSMPLPDGSDGQVLVYSAGSAQEERYDWQTKGFVPAGGTSGQVLTKTSNSNYASSWQTKGFVPAGGSYDQVLVKSSGGNYDSTWKTKEFIPEGGMYGQVLVKRDQGCSWKRLSDSFYVPTPTSNDIGKILVVSNSASTPYTVVDEEDVLSGYTPDTYDSRNTPWKVSGTYFNVIFTIEDQQKGSADVDEDVDIYSRDASIPISFDFEMQYDQSTTYTYRFEMDNNGKVTIYDELGGDMQVTIDYLSIKAYTQRGYKLVNLSDIITSASGGSF